MRSFIRFLFVFVLVLGSSYLRAQDTHIMLFETFTNSYDGCTLNNNFDADFKTTLASPISSQLIHLNHHISNVGDPMTYPEGILEMQRLSGQSGSSLPIMDGAVDHTILSFARLTGTHPGCLKEWTDRMNERKSLDPPVRIKLLNAKIDKIGSTDHWRIIATVQVEALENITSPMNIFYAITEDGIIFQQCPDATPPGPKLHNNVVRYCRTVGTNLNLNGKTAGTKVTTTYTQDISKGKSYGFKLDKMKLISFVESGTTDYEVVQAALLKTNLDTLQAPAATLSITESNLNGISYHPDDLITIIFDKTNVDSVNIEWSSNNGSSWQSIGHSNGARIFWTAPNVTTSQGKIRISELKTGSPMVTQSGTFSIVGKDRDIKVIHPNGNDTAFIGKPFTIEWSKIGVDSVKIEYSNNGGGNWGLIKPFKTGTTHIWTPTAPQTEQGLIRISWVMGDGSTVGASSDPFHVLIKQSGSVSQKTEGTNFDIRVYPQPLRMGGTLNVELNLAHSWEIAFKVYDLLGKEVQSFSPSRRAQGNSVVELPIGSLSAGVYILEARDNVGGRITQRIELY